MRDFLLSIGILLGIVTAQADPQLNFRLYRHADAIYINAEVQSLTSPEFESLINAGNAISLLLQVKSNTMPTKTFTHVLSFDPLRNVYTVSLPDRDQKHQVANYQAALDLFTRFYAEKLPIQLNSMPENEHLNLNLRVLLQMTDRPDFDTGPLWNYHNPQANVRFASYKEIPL